MICQQIKLGTSVIRLFDMFLTGEFISGNMMMSKGQF